MVDIRVCESKEALAESAAAHFLERFQRKGGLSVALSGGSTPGPAYKKISELDIDWLELNVWWVDERFVPPSDEASNERLVREAWLNQIGMPTSQVHPMYRPGSPAEAAMSYESAWLNAFGPEGGVDLAFMGIGPDGHTASIFPGDRVSLTTERLVLATLSPAGVAQRISLTLRALSRCHELVFLVTGAEKAPYVQAILDDSGDWPACQVARSANKVILLTDRAALG